MEEGGGFTYKPIGHVKSIFQGMTSFLLSPKIICCNGYYAGKSGTPRQSGLSKHARARFMSLLGKMKAILVAPLPQFELKYLDSSNTFELWFAIA